MTPHEFFELLWGAKPEDQYLLLWTGQTKQSAWFRDLKQAGDAAMNANGSDIYMGIGLSKADHGPYHRAASGEITGLTGMTADIDIKSKAHPGNHPLTIEEALTVVPPYMPPSLVLGTGNGIQVWWLFKEPFLIETEEDRNRATRLQMRWHTLLRDRARQSGWAYERLADLARILRIPGTTNHKDPQEPKPVITLSTSTIRYNVSDFESALDDIGVLDPETEQKTAQKWQEAFKDVRIRINPNARFPQEKLDAWMENDPRFRNTWERRRDTLKDSTNSGYDMALADFGVDQGMSPQEIVDLIIHHRTIHRQKWPKHISYYQRTIARAMDRPLAAAVAGGSTPNGPAPGDASPPPPAPTGLPPTSTDAAPQGAPVAPGEAQATETTTRPKVVDELVAKQVLCRDLSAVLGVEIIRNVKIKGKVPQYRMELARPGGGVLPIEFDHVDKLIRYGPMESALAAAVGHVIPDIPPKTWKAIAQKLLASCEEVESPELEWAAQTKLCLERYLVNTGLITSIEGQNVAEQRQPLLYKDRIAVSAIDFGDYLESRKIASRSLQAIANDLHAIGAIQARVRGPKHKDQNRWLLPLEDFDPADYKTWEKGFTVQ
jgi:hypothetical protein